MIDTSLPTVFASLPGLPGSLQRVPDPLGAVQPLQATVTGGSAAVVVLGLVGLAVAVGLSLLIGYEALRGYRGSDDTGMLLLATGIVLLTAVPNTVRVVVPTFTDAPGGARVLLATLLELLGLACILLAIYGRPGR